MTSKGITIHVLSECFDFVFCRRLKLAAPRPDMTPGKLRRGSQLRRWVEQEEGKRNEDYFRPSRDVITFHIYLLCEISTICFNINYLLYKNIESCMLYLPIWHDSYLWGMLWLVCAMLGGLAAASLTAALIRSPSGHLAARSSSLSCRVRSLSRSSRACEWINSLE